MPENRKGGKSGTHYASIQAAKLGWVSGVPTTPLPALFPQVIRYVPEIWLAMRGAMGLSIVHIDLKLVQDSAG